MRKVTTINTLLVKPEHADTFIATQRAFASAMASAPNGLLGGRLYKSLDGSRFVLVSLFQSLEAQSAIIGSAEFAAHLAKLRPLVESASPIVCEEAYTHGRFE